jgi:phage terminase large subunit
MSLAALEEAPKRLHYRGAGGAAKLLSCRAPEILFDGPRGTGKSRAVAEYLIQYAIRFPGTRILVLRKTRASLSESFLVTFEGRLAVRCPSALSMVQRSHRTKYTIGASEIVISGLDMESRQRSGEYALIFVEEANELTENDWEMVQGCLRWKDGGGYHQIVGACNPDSPGHWLWKRHRKSLTGELAGFQRIASRHTDNPSLDADYLERLSRLSGVRRKRYFEGEWFAAEGQVFDNFSEDRHWITVPEDKDGKRDYNALSISWYFASADWGTSKPGCLGIWGVDVEGRLYEVAEVYFAGKRTAWWADALVELNRRFPIRIGVGDPARPDMITEMNLALGYRPDGPEAIFFKADNKRASSPNGDMGGLNLVHDWLDPQSDGRPRLFFCRDNTPFGIDSALRESGKPCSTVEETPSYVWAKNAEGNQDKDSTDQRCEDHGWDQTRYACTFARGKDLSGEKVIPPDEPGTYGDLYGHNELMAEMQAEEEGLD